MKKSWVWVQIPERVHRISGTHLIWCTVDRDVTVSLIHTHARCLYFFSFLYPQNPIFVFFLFAWHSHSFLLYFSSPSFNFNSNSLFFFLSFFFPSFFLPLTVTKISSDSSSSTTPFSSSSSSSWTQTTMIPWRICINSN